MSRIDGDEEIDGHVNRRSRFREIGTYQNTYFTGVILLLVGYSGLLLTRKAIEAALEPDYNNWKFMSFMLAETFTSLAFGAILHSKDQSPTRRWLGTGLLILTKTVFDLGFWVSQQPAILGALLGK